MQKGLVYQVLYQVFCLLNFCKGSNFCTIVFIYFGNCHSSEDNYRKLSSYFFSFIYIYIYIYIGGAAGGGYSQVIPMEEVFFFASDSCLINKAV